MLRAMPDAQAGAQMASGALRMDILGAKHTSAVLEVNILRDLCHVWLKYPHSEADAQAVSAAGAASIDSTRAHFANLRKAPAPCLGCATLLTCVTSRQALQAREEEIIGAIQTECECRHSVCS